MFLQNWTHDLPKTPNRYEAKIPAAIFYEYMSCYGEAEDEQE